MQEDVEQRSVALIISTVKLTGRALKAAMAKFLACQKEAMARARSGWGACSKRFLACKG